MGYGDCGNNGGGGGAAAFAGHSSPSSHSAYHAGSQQHRRSGDEFGTSYPITEGMVTVSNRFASGGTSTAAGAGGGGAGAGTGAGTLGEGFGAGEFSPFQRGSRNSQRRSALAGDDLIKLKRWSDTSEDTK